MYKIKQFPEDFKVNEVMDLRYSINGRYSYVLLEKKNLNTIDAIQKIANSLKINKKRIGFAGNKDKNAITKQHISIFDIPKQTIDSIKIDNIKIKFLGYGDKPISLGDHKYNEFKIIVRNLRIASKLIDFIENYFDEQRFSTKNPFIGKLILKKEFEKVSKLINFEIKDIKKLKFYLHSYQSYLFNQVLSLYLKDRFKDYFRIEYSLGDFIFLRKKPKNFKIPLMNFDTIFENNEIERLYTKILNKEDIKKEDFLIRSIPNLVSETFYRNTFVDLAIKSKFLKDELNKDKFKQVLKFKLPKGSYATIVVKKMFSR